MAPSRAESARPASDGAQRPALPTPLTRFFGRKRELEQLAAQLREGTYRILTIQGPGGIGKTRLALEVARRLWDHFADGVFFVPLTSVERVEEIPTAIARALQLPLSERTPATEQVQRFLAERHLLLLLDNVEHLLEVDAWLFALVAHAPRLRLLLTSRQRLHALAEDLHQLTGLPVPATAASLAEAAVSPAVRLFVDRAHRRNKAFDLRADNVGAVIEICQLVDGLPLGIELASTWIQELECAAIAARIRETLDFLAADLRDLPPQHRSLRAIFEHSWALLPLPEQRTLARLSVFRESFTRRAAAEVADATALHLDRLRYKSLLRVAGGGRLAMHELVRQYAREQLDREPEAAERTLARHAEWYLDFLTDHCVPLYKSAPHEAAAAFLLDLANVRAAWQRALAQGGHALNDPALRALGRFYRLLGYHEEGVTLFGAAAAQYRGSPARAPAEGAEGAEAAGPAHPLLSRLLLEQVRCAIGRAEASGSVLAQIAEAKARAQAAGALYDRVEARVLEGKARRLLGQLEAAMDVLGAALEESRQVGLPELEAETLYEMGRILHNRSQFEASSERYRAALVLQRALNQPIEEQKTLLYLGVNALLRLDYARGMRYLQDASALAPATLAPATQSRIANALGFLEAALGNYPRALLLRQECGRLAKQLGDVAQQSHAFLNLCVIHTMEGRLEAALEMGQAAVELACRSRLPEPTAFAQMHFGYAHLARGEWAQAGERLRAARAGWQALGHQPLVMEATAGLAHLAQAQQDDARATRYASELYHHVMEYGVVGTGVPFRLYLICYHVLHASGLAAQAAQVLAKGCADLHSVAAKIPDPATRHAFLHHVPPNRALLTACEDASRSS